MKAITVRQPWAECIIFGGKDVENRTRNIAGSYRGPLVIHAGEKWDSIGALIPGVQRAIFGTSGLDSGALGFLALGMARKAAVGTVDLVEVHHDERCSSHSSWELPESCSPWALGGHHHLILANPRPFPEPIPHKGALGLWNFPDELLPAGWLR